jgi:ribonuclease P protein component
MRRSTDFTLVLRAGVRARRGHVVVHQHLGLHDGAATVGMIVGKAVGGSVVRHRVARRLRAQLADRVLKLSAGSGTVVRALPSAAAASSIELGADLDAALGRLARPR